MTANTLTPTQNITGYRARPATPDDLPGIHALMLVVGAADDNPRVATLEDLRHEFDDPWSDAAVDSQAWFAPDGQVVAYARLFSNPEPEEAVRVFTDDYVHPDHEAALYDALLEWIVARGTAKARALATATGFSGPALLRLGVTDHLTERMARFERFGFRRVRYFYRMRRDLSQPIPEVHVPAGLTLTTFRPELSEGARQALDEAFRDHWSHEPITRDDWEQFFVGSTTFRPDLTPVVLDGDEVAAVSYNKVDPEENERQGYSTGWIQTLGTRRPWRKRGLASALLAWSMRAFKAEGLQYASLGVDAENPTGALRLYEGLGFVTYRRGVAFDRPIALEADGSP